MHNHRTPALDTQQIGRAAGQEAQPERRPVQWYKITNVNPTDAETPPSLPAVMLGRICDSGASTVGLTDVAIVVLQAHVADDVILAWQPGGGTGQQYNGIDVPLEEVPVLEELFWGYLSSDWTPGSNTVTLQPCNGPSDSTALTWPGGGNVPTITAYIQFPAGSQCPSFSAGPSSGKPILAYRTDAKSRLNYLIDPPLLPVPTYKYQVIAANNPTAPYVADYVRAHG